MKSLLSVIRVEIIFYNIVIVFSIQICIMNVNVRVQCDQEYHEKCLIVVSLVTIVLLCHLSRIYNLPVHNSASSLALFLPFFPSFSFFQIFWHMATCVCIYDVAVVYLTAFKINQRSFIIISTSCKSLVQMKLLIPQIHSS